MGNMNVGATKTLTPVMEDYLETIYELDQTKKVVRVKDIAQSLDVKMPTVTRMLKTLRDRELVAYQKYEYVELTPEGEKIGTEIQRRHELLLKFLTGVLKIEFKIADEEACKLEHHLSASTLQRLTTFMNFIHDIPETSKDWFEHLDKLLAEEKKEKK